MNIEELKEKYNHWIKRNKAAEEFFREKSMGECMKYLDLFNEITRELSKLMRIFKVLTGRDMTEKEMFEGFS